MAVSCVSCTVRMMDGLHCVRIMKITGVISRDNECPSFLSESFIRSI